MAEFIEWIDQYLINGVPKELRPSFKGVAKQRLKESESLDPDSFEWAEKRIDGCQHYNCVLDELGKLKRLLQIDSLKQEARNSINSNNSTEYENYVPKVWRFWRDFEQSQPKMVIDVIKDKWGGISLSATQKGVIEIHSQLGSLKDLLLNWEYLEFDQS